MSLKVKQKTQTPQSEVEKIGIHSAVIKSFDAIDKNDELDLSEKRALIYSAYCFRCLFDDDLITAPPKILEKYKLVKGEVMPEKLELYDLVAEIVSLNNCTASLKALWYISFAYVLLLDAPFDEDVFEFLQKELSTDTVFKAVLYSPHSIYMRDSIEELQANPEFPSFLVEWYRPYIVYKSHRDNQDRTREEVRFLDWLAKGEFAKVFTGTEKLLDSNPDDDGILLCNIAARVSLDGIIDEQERLHLLKQTLALIESALERGSVKKVFLHYYAAIIHVALKNKDAAKANLAISLEIDPNFESAKRLIKVV